MGRRGWAALAMWLVAQGCADVDRDLPDAYRRLEVPEATLASAAARDRGRVLFLESCALCHGERGDGNGRQREGLIPRPRDLASAVWRQSTSPRRVFYAIREGNAGTAMPAAPALSDDDVWNITAFVLALGEAR